MTYEEALKDMRLSELWEEVKKYGPDMYYKDLIYPLWEEIDRRVDKYRWHDLWKDSNDLPKDGERVEFWIDVNKIGDEWREYETESNMGHFQTSAWQWWKKGPDAPTFTGDFYSDDCLAKGQYDTNEVIAWRYIEPFQP